MSMILTVIFTAMVLIFWLVVVLAPARKGRYFDVSAGRLFQWGIPFAIVLAGSMELLHVVG